MEFKLRQPKEKSAMATISPIGEVQHQDQLNINNNSSNHFSFNKHKPLPPISKIPGLNPDSEYIASAEQKTFRTLKVLETDSSYIRLAKQGGRKNLLQYNEYAPKESGTGKSNKENQFPLTKRPDLLDHQEYRPTAQQRSPVKNHFMDDNNNDEESANNNNNNSSAINNNNGPNGHSKSISNGPGKRIMEIKKQSINTKKDMKTSAMAQESAIGKERPDILPIDNVEILRHLNVPRKPVLPRLTHQAKAKSRSIRVGGR